MKDKTVYDIDCVDLQGNPFPLQQFTGRPLLIANTASLCGFTPQLGKLEAIWQSNKERGLIVLGVPSNDFGQQEPGSSTEIASFCSAKFNVSFPLLAKASVRGDNAHPLFRWLAEEGGFLSKPRWNFYKYIIGHDGHLKNWFVSTTDPSSQRVTRALTKVIVECAH